MNPQSRQLPIALDYGARQIGGVFSRSFTLQTSTGFVRCPRGTTSARVNPWTESELSDTWHFVEAD